MIRLLVLTGLLFLSACSQPQAPDSAPTPATPAPEPVCLDTTLLQKDGIEFYPNGPDWTISVRRRGLPGNRINRMDWHFYRSCPEMETRIDSLIIYLNDRQQIFYPGEYAGKEEQKLVRPAVYFEDYDFDGELDFRISQKIDSLNNHRYQYFLYDRNSGQFRQSELLSGTVNLSVKKEEGLLTTFESFAPGDQIFRASTFQFRKGVFTEVSRTEQNYEPSIDRYLLQYYELRRGTFTLVGRDTITSSGVGLQNY